MRDEIESSETAHPRSGVGARAAYWLVVLVSCFLLAAISYLATQRFMPGE